MSQYPPWQRYVDSSDKVCSAQRIRSTVGPVSKWMDLQSIQKKTINGAWEQFNCASLYTWQIGWTVCHAKESMRKYSRTKGRLCAARGTFNPNYIACAKVMFQRKWSRKLVGPFGIYAMSIWQIQRKEHDESQVEPPFSPPDGQFWEKHHAACKFVNP